jgi:hypothetical protein
LAFGVSDVVSGRRGLCTGKKSPRTGSFGGCPVARAEKIMEDRSEKMKAVQEEVAGASPVGYSERPEASREPAGDAPQHVTRGADSQGAGYAEGDLGIHWLRGSLPSAVYGKVRLLLRQWFGDSEDLSYGRYLYRAGEVFASGKAWLWRDGRTGSNKNTACVDIPGETFDGLTAIQQYGLFRDLAALGFRCSRMDLKFDDYEKIISPEGVYQAAVAGHVQGFKKWHFHTEGKIGSTANGQTLILGKRGQNGSGWLLRCYDKGAESDGRIQAIRWEGEASGVRAKCVFEHLATAANVEAFTSGIGQFLGGSVDFLERVSPNLDRCPRLEWWQRIVNLIGRAKIKVQRVKTSIDKAREWVAKAVAPSLAMIRKGYEFIGLDDGEFWDELRSLVDAADSRLRGHHKAAIAEFGIVPAFP